MSRWRGRANELLLASSDPIRRRKIQRTISSSKDAYALWGDVFLEFKDAHDDPPDESFIAGVYDYAKWCITQYGNADLLTATIVSFWEELATDQQVVRDLPRWLSTPEFEGVKNL
jgi:hypothetical protein